MTYIIYRVIISLFQPPLALHLCIWLQADIKLLMKAIDDSDWTRTADTDVLTEWIKDTATFTIERM